MKQKLWKKYDKRYQRFTDTVNQPLMPQSAGGFNKRNKNFLCRDKKE